MVVGLIFLFLKCNCSVEMLREGYWISIGRLTASTVSVAYPNHLHLQVDMFYVQSVSCFVWTQTSYHVVPCWSSILQLCGNSFVERSHIFLPLASLSTHKVIFPPAAKGSTAYQNIMIYNHDANTPLRC